MNLNILIKKEVKTKLWPHFLDMFPQAQMLSSETRKASPKASIGQLFPRRLIITVKKN